MYCRVSTDKDEQKNSIDNQKRFFREYIDKNPEWEFYQIYVDEGQSGTGTAKREGFNRMIKDAKENKFELILTKEISRFARNTLDSIYYTRLLKNQRIGVFFINDNINTLDPDSELRLTIMASIAQEESRKTSDRVKWGQKRSMEKGVVFGTRIYGFDIEKGKLHVNEAEANIVRIIFSKYIYGGLGVCLIAKDLTEMGVPTPNGAVIWSSATILKILKNEKYIGTLKQKKYITTDYLTHLRKRNDGEEQMIIIENNHNYIIDKELFYMAQNELIKRRKCKQDKSRYSGRYCFSGKIVCGCCGAKYKRRVNGKGTVSQTFWKCSSYVTYGKEKINSNGNKTGCNNKSIREDIINYAFLTALDKTDIDKYAIFINVMDSIKKVIVGKEHETNRYSSLQEHEARLHTKKRKLLDLYTDEIITKNDFQNSYENLNKRIESLHEQIGKRKSVETEPAYNDKIFESIRTKVENIAMLKDFSEEVCKQLLEMAASNSSDEIIFYIKSEKISVSLYGTQYLQQKEQSK